MEWVRVRFEFNCSNPKFLVEGGHVILTPILHIRKKRYKKIKWLFLLAASDSLLCTLVPTDNTKQMCLGQEKNRRAGSFCDPVFIICSTGSLMWEKQC